MDLLSELLYEKKILSIENNKGKYMKLKKNIPYIKIISRLLIMNRLQSLQKNIHLNVIQELSGVVMTL